MQTQDSVAGAYSSKIEKAEAILLEFSKTSSEDHNRFAEGELKAALQKIGGTSNETLVLLTPQDIEDLEFQGNKKRIPKLLARQIHQILQHTVFGNSEAKPYVTDRTADRMTPEQLVGHYSPDEDNAVSRKLATLSKGQPFVVFLPEGGVDVETTSLLLKEIRQGFKARPSGTIQVGGSYRKIHKLGVNPERVAEENPLFPGRALRPDGTCDQTNRSWNGIDAEVRQLLHLAVARTGEVVLSLDKAHDLLDTALQTPPEEAFKRLANRYQKAAALFEELKAEGNLPKLKLRLGRASQIQSGSNDPFNK